ncbi:MAG TPA: chromosome segregation protein SMC [Polyangia bacterium]|nr:chromosome segregation protein SMC [Polyangia bacterium]
MKIKRIEICGFKSFVDKTTISFPDPITSIVGPNGCGKSNIVDAIRWVMGEQSAKHLRGRAMEDVIFAGSESRGPAGLAEVSLTFDSSALDAGAAPGGVPWGAAAPEEIVVTRRLYRDGSSEYLLNGVPSRLRDVVEFFLGTGVGSKAYAIIEQGRIGFIVSSRPEDRRGLIDEAAGITRYKSKKKAAERRMDSTRQHLLRVSDIIGEIDGRLRSLRLQAQKAERYKRYKSELKDLDLWSSAQRYLGHLVHEKSLGDELSGVRDTHEAESTSLEAGEAAADAERLAVGEEAAELATAKDEIYALSNKAQLGMQRADHHDAEATELAGRVEAGRQEITELRARAAVQAANIEEISNRLSEIDAAADASEREYEAQAQVQEARRATLAEARRELEAAQAEVAAARASIARREAERAGALQRRDDLIARVARVAADETAAGERLDVLIGEERRLRDAIDDLAVRVEAAQGAATQTEARLGVVRGELSRGELELETLREEAHRRRSRLASLTEIQDRYERFQTGVRAIMQAHRTTDGGDGIKGVVADIVQPPPELETAVEAVLGERLGNVIVDSHEAGVEAIQYLKRTSEGRSSFIPRALRGQPARGEVVFDATSGMSDGVTAEANDAELLPSVDDDMIASTWPKGDGVRGPLLDLIGYDRQYGEVATYLLGDVLVVEDLERALTLWRETQTTKTIVTLEGEVIDPKGVVTGGSRESALTGVLEQKREIRELEQVMARLDADLEAALARQIERKQSAADLSRALDETAATLRADEMTLFGLRKDLDRVVEEGSACEARREQLAGQRAELGRAADENEQRLIEAMAGLEGDGRAAEEGDARAVALRARTTALSDEVDVAVGELTTLKVAASQAEERRQNARQTLERLRADRTEEEARAARIEATLADDEARAATLRQDALRLRDEASLWNAEAEARARAHGDRQGALEERQARLAEREAQLRAARTEVARLAQALSKLEMSSQEVVLRRTSLEEQVSDRYRDVVLGAVVHEYHLRTLFGADEEKRAGELRGLIERMGEINLTAIEESEELQKRFDFLTTQKADLESAIGELETAIERINRTSRRRFRETFDAVNAQFEAVFPRMFGGGKASLVLTDESDMLETGIEIVANPPGKKVSQNIELLSGGEKALTAVSLLFAIFLVKPSPFCVLDEVDAPLDEANVGRFNQVVREMTDRSQFILITHNRRTMEIADRLCGITMEEPGVSRLVAVNLRGGPSRIGKARIVTESTTDTGAQA